MAEGLRDIKSRIEALRKTASITESLQHISIAKTRKIQSDLMNYQKYLVAFNRILFGAASYIEDHPLVKENESDVVLFILVTSDRGLVGSYHQNLFKRTLQEIKSFPNHRLIVIGKKGFSFAKKHHLNMVHEQPIVNRDFVTTFHFKEQTKMMYQALLNKQISKILMIYTHYVNRGLQKVKVEQVLPLNISEKAKQMSSEREYLYDEDPNRLIEKMALMHLDTQIYGSLIDAQLSEHTSRLNAMQAATDNAKQINKELSMLYHRTRQQAITNELIDIVNGSNI